MSRNGTAERLRSVSRQAEKALLTSFRWRRNRCGRGLADANNGVNRL